MISNTMPLPGHFVHQTLTRETRSSPQMHTLSPLTAGRSPDTHAKPIRQSIAPFKSPPVSWQRHPEAQEIGSLGHRPP